MLGGDGRSATLERSPRSARSSVSSVAHYARQPRMLLVEAGTALSTSPPSFARSRGLTGAAYVSPLTRSPRVRGAVSDAAHLANHAEHRRHESRHGSVKRRSCFHRSRELSVNFVYSRLRKCKRSGARIRERNRWCALRLRGRKGRARVSNGASTFCTSACALLGSGARLGYLLASGSHGRAVRQLKGGSPFVRSASALRSSPLALR